MDFEQTTNFKFIVPEQETRLGWDGQNSKNNGIVEYLVEYISKHLELALGFLVNYLKTTEK